MTLSMMRRDARAYADYAIYATRLALAAQAAGDEALADWHTNDAARCARLAARCAGWLRDFATDDVWMRHAHGDY